MGIASDQSELKVSQQYRQRGLGWAAPVRGEGGCGRDRCSRVVVLAVGGGRGDAGDGDYCCREGPLPLLLSHAPFSPAVARATRLR